MAVTTASKFVRFSVSFSDDELMCKINDAIELGDEFDFFGSKLRVLRASFDIYCNCVNVVCAAI